MTQYHVPTEKQFFPRYWRYIAQLLQKINLRVFDFANCNCAESIRQAKTNHGIKIPIYSILHIVSGQRKIGL